MNPLNESTKSGILKKWLDKLQEDSWNLELLISGFAIFGLFQLFRSLNVYFYEIRAEYLDLSRYNVDWFLTIPITISIGAVVIFIVCLLVHIFFRGLWIGAVGLRYVSGDVNIENLKFNSRFDTYLKKKIGSYDEFIIRLEKIASSIFALTYILFFTLLSLVLFTIELRALTSLLAYFFELSSQTYNIVYFSFLGLGLLVGLDFLTLGLLKRIKYRWFVVIYKPIYIFITTITLSFLWRPLLYNFMDHRRLKWVVVGIVPFLFSLYAISMFSYNNYAFYPQNNFNESGKFHSVYFKENARHSFLPEFYDDLRQAKKEKEEYWIIRIMSLPSYTISSPVLEVFVRYDSEAEKYIQQIDSSLLATNKLGLQNLEWENGSDYEKEKALREEKQREIFEKFYEQHPGKAESLFNQYISDEQSRYRKQMQKIQNALKEIYRFEINDKPIDKDAISVVFYEHPNFGEKGFLCVFPLTDVRKGTNYLTLKKKFVSQISNEFNDLDFTIPFVYKGH